MHKHSERRDDGRRGRLGGKLATGISVTALILAATGGAYAASSSSGSISACVHHKGGAMYVAHKCGRHDRRVTWSVAGPQGERGPQGSPGNAGAPGAPGPGGVILHVDTTTPFESKTLGKVGPWTITATCATAGPESNLEVRAAGPSDSSADGSEIGGAAIVYSETGNDMPLGDDLGAGTGIAFNTVNLDLYSASAGAAAHVSLFKYEQGPGNPDGFRCKISGTGYAAS
jgi:hypothetical protein